MSKRIDLVTKTIGLTCILAACGSTTENAGGRPEAVDGGLGLIDTADARVDTGVDAGQAPPDAGTVDAGCPPYSRPQGAGCTTDLTWTDIARRPSARDHHVTFLQARSDSATLYVSGGIDLGRRTVTTDLWYAPVASDGSVSGWFGGPRPLLPQMGAALVVQPDRAYLVSGKTLAGGRVVETDQVVSLALGADGTPGAWRVERPLPAPTFHGTAEHVDRWVFVVGGIEQGATATTTIWRAELEDDGRLSPWVAARALPQARTHHASFVHGRKLFVIGGLDGSGAGFASTPYSDYLVTTIDANGELSPWTKTDLPFGMSTHSATTLDDRVILAGGFDADLNIVDTVRLATVVDGRLEDFRALTSLPFARAHVHHMPRWRGWLYTMGGNIGNQVGIDRAVRGTLR